MHLDKSWVTPRHTSMTSCTVKLEELGARRSETASTLSHYTRDGEAQTAAESPLVVSGMPWKRQGPWDAGITRLVALITASGLQLNNSVLNLTQYHCHLVKILLLTPVKNIWRCNESSSKEYIIWAKLWMITKSGFIVDPLKVDEASYCHATTPGVFTEVITLLFWSLSNFVLASSLFLHLCTLSWLAIEQAGTKLISDISVFWTLLSQNLDW